MKKWTLKRVLVLSFSTITLVAITFVIFIQFILTNGFRDYKEYCSGYIQPVEEYFSRIGEHPSSISHFEEYNDPYNRYEPNDCGYMHNDKGFRFMATSGFGVVIYISENKMWVYD